jgi:RNA polymerase sigma-70 factor (ECF subfamily)
VLLAQLPDKPRLPIEYVKIEGRSVEETARLTGLSASAVKIGVHGG